MTIKKIYKRRCEYPEQTNMGVKWRKKKERWWSGKRKSERCRRRGEEMGRVEELAPWEEQKQK